MRPPEILALSTLLCLGLVANAPGRAAERAVPPSGRYFISLLEGDSLEEIAARLYGDANLWSLLAEANNISDPETLQIGRHLEVPFREQQLTGRRWYRDLRDETDQGLDGCWGVPDLAVAINLDRQGDDEVLYLDPSSTAYRWDEDTDDPVHHTVDLVIAPDLESRQVLQRFRVLETQSAGCLLSLLAFQVTERDTLVLVEVWTDRRTAGVNASSDIFFFLISDDLEVELLLFLGGASEAIHHSVASGSSTTTDLALFLADAGEFSFRVVTVEEHGEHGPAGTHWSKRTENRYRLLYDPKSRSLDCIGVSGRCR